MHVSRRAASLRPSSTLAVAAKARVLKARGVSVLSFAAGEPDFETPWLIRQAAIEAITSGQTRYPPVPGDDATRRVIAEKLARENGIPGVTPEHVVVSSGGKHSLYQVFQALIDPARRGEPDAEVLLPVPAWVSYAPQAELAGARVVELPTSAATDYKITPSQLRGAITARSRVLVLNSPSNPCGTMYTPDELRALGAVVADAARSIAPDLVVVSDEIYEKIIFGGIPHFSIGSIPEIAERVITVNGLSKSYAMTGWRVGYAAGSGAFGLEIADALCKLQGQSTTGIPTFILPAIRAALTQCGDECERMREAFGRRAELTWSLVSKIPGLVTARPTGAFYVFPDVSTHFGKRHPKLPERILRSAADFAEALLEVEHVAVVPGEDFGTGGEKCIRLTFACGEDQIREGLARIGGFVRALH